MPVRIKGFEPEWIEIECNGDTLELLVRRPTHQELSEEMELAREGSVRRRTALIQDWKGVVAEDGAEVPFSDKSFAALAESVPLMFAEIVNEMDNVFYGLREEAAKNSRAPLGASTASETEPKTGQSRESPNTPTCESSSASVKKQDCEPAPLS